MRNPRVSVPVLVLLALVVIAPVLAQSSSTTRPTSGSDRLFLSFIEEATTVDSQWWEGQLVFSDGDVVDVTAIRGILAFQILPDLEVGGRVGFGETDTEFGLPDGSGATDLDAWGKYYFGSRNGETEFAAGGVVTIPTGDDTAGLGNDAFSVGAFGSVRHRFARAILSANIGLRLNGDAEILGLAERDGEVSPSLGAALLFPLADDLTFVAEARVEGERFDGADTDARLLGGFNWRVGNQGQVRLAVGAGLDDGAPDVEFLGGYAFQF